MQELDKILLLTDRRFFQFKQHHSNPAAAARHLRREPAAARSEPIFSGLGGSGPVPGGRANRADAAERGVHVGAAEGSRVHVSAGDGAAGSQESSSDPNPVDKTAVALFMVLKAKGTG